VSGTLKQNKKKTGFGVERLGPCRLNKETEIKAGDAWEGGGGDCFYCFITSVYHSSSNAIY